MEKPEIRFVFLLFLSNASFGWSYVMQESSCLRVKWHWEANVHCVFVCLFVCLSVTADEMQLMTFLGL